MSFLRGLTLVVLLVFGAPSTEAQSQLPPTKSEQKESDDKSVGSELQVLRAQLAAMSSFQEQILSTVYWSLGTVASIAVVLVGFGWLANFRIYERDKESLAATLGSSLDKRLLALEASLQSKVSSGAESQTLSLEKSKEELRTELQSRLDALAVELRTEIEEASSNEAMRRESVQRDVALLRLDQLELQRDDWRQRTVFKNAIRCSRKILDESLDLGWSHKISRALDMLKDDLASLAAEGDTLDASEKAELVSVLGSVKPPHDLVAANIRAKAIDG